MQRITTGAMMVRIPICMAILLMIVTVPVFSLDSGKHKSLTQDAAREFAMSTEAVQLLSQAATEPDAYDWDTATAHAQTPNSPDGSLSRTALQAKQDCIAYIKQQSADFRSQLAVGNTGNALYLLGYALHTIQDFASHADMTNYEHSFLAFVAQDNPDDSVANVNQAKQWTGEFLKTVNQNLHPCAWERLRTFKHRLQESDRWRAMPSFSYKKETSSWSDSGVADYAKYWAPAKTRDARQVPQQPSGRYEVQRGNTTAAGRPIFKFNDKSKISRWLPSSEIGAELINAFASGLQIPDDLTWLFEGGWVDQEDGANISIQRSGSG